MSMGIPIDADGPTSTAARLRLEPIRQIDFTLRPFEDGFSDADTPETIALGDHATVVRPDPLDLTIHPGVTDAHQEHGSRVTLPTSYVADRPMATRLPNGMVDTDCFIICPDTHRYLFDSVRYHRRLARWGYETLDGWQIERDFQGITERNERVVVLGAQTNANYSHWLLESAVRALFFHSFDDGSRLYLTPPLTKHWQREILEIIGLDKERILELEPSGFVRFEEVIAVSRAMMNISTFMPAGIEALASLAPSTSGRRRIYSSRQHVVRRSIANEAEILNVLESHGFETVHPQELSVKEQIRTFAEAEAILGVHGSGLTNAIFSPSNATVIELQPESLAYIENAVVRTLAAIRNQRFVQVVYPFSEPHVDDRVRTSADITVDPVHLDKTLSRVLS
jgi:hypothetical protein